MHGIKPGVAVAVAMLVHAGVCGAAGLSHKPDGMIGASAETKAQTLSSFCMDGDFNIITADSAGKCIRVITPDDKLKSKWAVDFTPQVVAWRATDRCVLVAGAGKVAIINAAGAVVKAATYQADSGAASAVACSGDDVFVCARSRICYTVYRLSAGLENPKLIINGLRGCCGQMDLTCHEGVIYMAANCEFKVVKYDRDGKRIGDFGKVAGSSYFVGCCEPKNVTVAPDGSLFVSESSNCAVNRFSRDGKLLGNIGVIKGIGGCVRVTVGVNKDASKVYMLDTNKHVIRVLSGKVEG